MKEGVLQKCCRKRQGAFRQLLTKLKIRRDYSIAQGQSFRLDKNPSKTTPNIPWFNINQVKFIYSNNYKSSGSVNSIRIQRKFSSKARAQGFIDAVHSQVCLTNSCHLILGPWNTFNHFRMFTKPNTVLKLKITVQSWVGGCLGWWSVYWTRLGGEDGYKWITGGARAFGKAQVLKSLFLRSAEAASSQHELGCKGSDNTRMKWDGERSAMTTGQCRRWDEISLPATCWPP